MLKMTTCAYFKRYLPVKTINEATDESSGFYFFPFLFFVLKKLYTFVLCLLTAIIFGGGFHTLRRV